MSLQALKQLARVGPKQVHALYVFCNMLIQISWVGFLPLVMNNGLVIVQMDLIRPCLVSALVMPGYQKVKRWTRLICLLCSFMHIGFLFEKEKQTQNGKMRKPVYMILFIFFAMGLCYYILLSVNLITKLNISYVLAI